MLQGMKQPQIMADRLIIRSYYSSLEKAPMALEEEKSSYIDRARQEQLSKRVNSAGWKHREPAGGSCY